MMQALQEQLNQTSRHSSRLPSSDPPYSERARRGEIILLYEDETVL
jgi:hypothetical protein